jgi:SAM-dependent methyltransferase
VPDPTDPARLTMAGSIPTAPGFYLRPGLHVETYDAQHETIPGGDDVSFFRGLAERAGGPVLELGCGTGRVAIPLAEAGFEVVGLDRSAPMLAVAAERRRVLPVVVRRRLRFVEGDMTDFRLARRFALAFAAFRVFMALPDEQSQRSALFAIRRHLRPGGLLALDIFDPRLDLLTPEPRAQIERREFRHPTTGNTVVASVLSRSNDPVAQRFTQQWRFAEESPDGTLVREELEELTLRWTYRYEMRHLLELSGFEPIAEYSDYGGTPPAYGAEQIWLARRPAARR